MGSYRKKVKNFISTSYVLLQIPPAMQAGLIKRLMTLEDIANLVPEPVAQKRESYKRKYLIDICFL